MSSSNNFAQSITCSFRKLLKKKFTKRSSKKHTDSSEKVACTNAAQDTPDTTAWERVTLDVPKLENVRVNQVIWTKESTDCHDTLSSQKTTWLKRPAIESNKPKLTINPSISKYPNHTNVFDKLCNDFGELAPLNREPPLINNCDSCLTVPKSPKKRCPCEFERTQNSSLEDHKPKKSIFITGYLAKHGKTSRAHSARKGPNGNGSYGLIGPLFGSKKIPKSKDPLMTMCPPMDPKSSEQLTDPHGLTDEFESKLQKVENFERMIVDPNYQNETIRLALTPNLLS